MKVKMTVSFNTEMPVVTFIVEPPNSKNFLHECEYPIQKYSPNIRISAKRKTYQEAQNAIYRFFKVGEWEPGEIDKFINNIEVEEQK